MKKIRLSYLRWTVLAILYVFVLFASISSEIGEGYAVFIYPWLSKILSAISSLVCFSLDEWGIVLAVVWLLVFPFYGRLRRKCSWWRVLAGEVEFGLWMYVWFYWGWGMNYYRDSFFQRAAVARVAYDEKRFDDFLLEYTDGLNGAFKECRREGWMHSPDLFRAFREVDGSLNCRGSVPTSLDSLKGGGLSNDSCNLIQSEKVGGLSGSSFTMNFVQDEIKAMYQKVPEHYGLCRPMDYQVPKCSSFNGLYSNVGVLGFMGPFFAESHVNHELSVLEYPFTYAHELSHLLGVSSEAEANLWAFVVCSQHRHPLIRLSAYLGLLSYVRSNAFYLLTPAKFEQWESSVAPEVMALFYRVHAYWRSRYNPTLGELQSVMYTFYLKRNKIASGQKNYAQVIGMLLALPDFEISLP